MAIRYDKKINKEIYRTVYEFNKKVKELEGMTGVLIPGKISTKEIKESVYDRRELRRELKNLKKFLKPGAEEIIQTQAGYMSRYDIDVLKGNIRSAKARVNAKIQKMYNTELYIEGVGTKNTYASMGNQRYLNLLTKRKALEKDIKTLDREELARYIKLVNRSMLSDKNREWKEAYIDILEKEAYQFNVDKKYLDNIKEKMMKLPPEKFIEVYNKELGIQSIAEMYRMMIERTNGGLSLEGIKENVTSLYKNLSDKIDKIVE